MLPASVDERVEFLSDEWIAEATRYLKAAVDDRPSPGGISFSLCEALDDAPPSVAGDGRAAWHVRVDHGHVTADRGEIDGADVMVRGDYQAVLALAQTVYGAGPEATARAHRELNHRAGAAAFHVAVAAPLDPAVQDLLTGLHDHMAARTIENPDFTHRVRRLGLEKHVAQLEEDGYTVIENAVSSDFADELRDHVQREVLAHHPFTTNGLLLRHRVFEEVALHPLVCTAAQSVVGHGMILGAMSGTYKEAGPGLIPIHSDYPLVRHPFPEFGLIAVACWALDGWSEEAGPTWVMPGSHRNRRAPRRDEPQDGAVPIVMEKGSVAMWAHGVWHWQGDRASAGARVAIHVTYNRVFVRPLDDLSAVGDEMYSRNPPAFSTLMGQDDPFGKSSYTGHDMRRFAYAARTLHT